MKHLWYIKGAGLRDSPFYFFSKTTSSILMISIRLLLTKEYTEMYICYLSMIYVVSSFTAGPLHSLMILSSLITHYMPDSGQYDLESLIASVEVEFPSYVQLTPSLYYGLNSHLLVRGLPPICCCYVNE